MKKLMIAAAIVCAAAVAQAATWNWSCSGTGSKKIWYDGNSTTLLYTTTPAATIYLFDAADITQGNLLKGIRDGSIAGLASAGSIANTGIDTASKMVGKSLDPVSGKTGEHTFYMAAMDAAGNIFISDGVATTIQSTSNTDIAFGGLTSATQTNFTSDPTKSYSSAGWYAAAPEPTSGLLLLLGMGALALRRRRA